MITIDIVDDQPPVLVVTVEVAVGLRPGTARIWPRNPGNKKECYASPFYYNNEKIFYYDSLFCHSKLHFSTQKFIAFDLIIID